MSGQTRRGPRGDLLRAPSFVLALAVGLAGAACRAAAPARASVAPVRPARQDASQEPAPAQEPEQAAQQQDPAAQQEVQPPPEQGDEPQSPAVEEGDAPGWTTGEEPATGERPGLVSGWLSSRYLGRFAGSDEDDHDLYESLSLDVGDEARHKVTAHVFGRLSADLDGGENGVDPFFSLQDTEGAAVDGKLLDLYFDVHRVPRLEVLRVGRQIVHETPEIAWFDGVRVDSEARGGDEVRFGVYGGIPVRLYESASDDVLYGLWAEARPWKGGKVRADWMHIEDDRLLSEHDDDLYGLGLWQTVGEALLLEGAYTRLEGEDRDLRLTGAWHDQDEDLIVRASYYRLLETQRDLSLELDPFFETLRELDPYHQLGLLASKGVDEHLLLEAGVDLRRLVDDDDEGEFNHDFERYHLTAAYREAFVEELTLALTGDVWESDDLDIRTWGADATWLLREDQTLSLGSYYALYKQHLFFEDEREDVRTWYAKLRDRRREALALELGYEYENTDFQDFHTLRAGATWRF